MLNKKIALGTALWGWKIERKSCLQLLDFFYETHGRYIDTASNYPINGVLSQRYLAEDILSEWIRVNNCPDLKVIYKIGSIENQNISNNNLSSGYLDEEINRFLEKSQLKTIIPMIHWDDSANKEDIQNVVQFLVDQPFDSIGFSGIKNISLYRNVISTNNFKLPVYFEAKSNVIDSNVTDYFGFNNSRIFAYGIGATGLKLINSYSNDSSFRIVKGQDKHEKYLTKDVRTRISRIQAQNKNLMDVYDIGIALAENNERLYGYIIAPRTLGQLKKTLDTIFRIRN